MTASARSGLLSLRLPLAIRLFTLIAMTALAAIAAMFVAQQHSFRQGLLERANREAGERAEALLPLLREEYRSAAGWDRLRGNPRRFHWINDQASGRGPGFGRPPPPDRPPGMPMRGPHGPAHPYGLPRGDRPGTPSMQRFALYDAEDRTVIGPALRPSGALSFPIEDGGRLLGTLTMLPLPQLEDQLDIEFARAQWRAGGLSALGVLLLALTVSLLVSRRLSTPLSAMASHARQIADGDYSARLASQRGDELGALARDLDAMAEALERHRAARQRWTAEISHELRTPLAILRGEIEALEDGLRPFDQAALASLAAESRRLERLVDDLYQLALADSGALAYQFEDLDLSAAIEASLVQETERLAAAGLTLQTELVEGLRIRADQGRLQQLLANLLGNARRYTDAPGRVRIATRASGERVELRVEDSPPGVPEEALGRLFDPLYRLDESRSRAAGGAGLGLAIVARIAEAHGATLHAEASPLGGLCVRIGFPRR